MKRIALITDRRNSQLGEALSRDLTKVLNGHVEMSSHFKASCC